VHTWSVKNIFDNNKQTNVSKLSSIVFVVEVFGMFVALFANDFGGWPIFPRRANVSAGKSTFPLGFCLQKSFPKRHRRIA
jgi:hypothetical protein